MENCEIKMGLKGCKWSSLNAPGICTSHFHPFLGLGNSLFSQLALWGNKKWAPSIRVEKLEICQNKMGSKIFNWSSLNERIFKSKIHGPIADQVPEDLSGGQEIIREG